MDRMLYYLRQADPAVSPVSATFKLPYAESDPFHHLHSLPPGPGHLQLWLDYCNYFLIEIPASTLIPLPIPFSPFSTERHWREPYNVSGHVYSNGFPFSLWIKAKVFQFIWRSVCSACVSLSTVLTGIPAIHQNYMALSLPLALGTCFSFPSAWNSHPSDACLALSLSPLLTGHLHSETSSDLSLKKSRIVFNIRNQSNLFLSVQYNASLKLFPFSLSFQIFMSREISCVRKHWSAPFNWHLYVSFQLYSLGTTFGL